MTNQENRPNRDEDRTSERQNGQNRQTDAMRQGRERDDQDKTDQRGARQDERQAQKND